MDGAPRLPRVSILGIALTVWTVLLFALPLMMLLG
jgi:hypothetical protein